MNPLTRNKKTSALIASALIVGSISIPATAQAETTNLAVEDITTFHISTTPENLSLSINNYDENTDPANTNLTIPDSALSDKPTNFNGIETPGYHLPLFADDFLSVTGADATTPQVGLHFIKVAGPGKIYLGSGHNDQSFAPVLNTKQAELKAPATLPANAFGDNLAQLIFEKPGKYKVLAQAVEVNDSADLTNETVTPAKFKRSSAPQVYTFLVGKAGLADTSDPFAGMDLTTPAETPQETATEATGKDTPVTEPAGDPLAKDEEITEKPAETTDAATTQPQDVEKKSDKPLPTPNAPVPAGKAPAAPTGGISGAISNLLGSAKCFPSFEGGQGELTIRPKVKDDRQSPSKWYNFNEISFTIGDAGKAKLPAAVGAIPAGSNVWMIGSTQVKDVPWVGANTMSDTVLSQTTGEVTWTLSSFEGPGALEVFTSGNFGTLVGNKWFSGNGNSGSGSVTIPKNTHVHPNWVFSAPGVYKVGITQTATLKNGKQVSGTDVLFFQVGGGNGARDGHFDVGSEVAQAGAKRVWKDSNGKPCTPSQVDLQAAGLGSLAATGSGTLTFPLLVFGVGMGVLGLGMRVRTRQD